MRALRGALVTAAVVAIAGASVGCGGGRSGRCGDIERILLREMREDFPRLGVSEANGAALMERFSAGFADLCIAASEVEIECLSSGLESRSDKACDAVWTRMLMLL